MEGKAVHLIGIGGSGLSAIARVLAESGYTVSGSDRQDSPLLDSLRGLGVQVQHGHRAENVGQVDLVIRSSAITDDNVEVQAAVKAGIPVLKRSDFLGQLMEGRTGIAVAGSHGKTTTTAMIAWMLSALGQDPTFIIGGVAHNLGSNARAGRGQAFVIEADEYDRMFLGLTPSIAVVTSIEHDHPDCFPTREEYYQAFVDFSRQILPGGTLLGSRADAGAAWLLEQADAAINRRSYGLEAQADYQALSLEPNSHGAFSFAARLPQGAGPDVHLQVPGQHNVLNALAALAVAHLLGLPLEPAAEALASFTGTGRRFEVLGEAAGVTVVNDYAHHPTEIRATLAAARSRYPGRNLWAVWQPHTYTRTLTLLGEFLAAFGDADRVVVTEVYPAREPVSKDFSARQIVAGLGHANKWFAADLNQAGEILLDQLAPGDVVLVLSAGDADQISSQVLAALQKRSME